MTDRLLVGEDGGLRLSREQNRRWGLTPGAAVEVKETPEGLLLRRADPVLTKVYVEPTSACNLSCRTCIRNSWTEPIGTMSMMTYRSLVEGLVDVPTLRKVSFWGFGEPLFHPEIVDMVAMARGLGAETQLVTNALLLDRDIAEGLVNAGLDSLVVSVDGASRESYSDVRSGADLQLVHSNMQTLREARNGSPRHNPEIGIEFVVMRRNVGDLPRLRQLAVDIGASFIVLTNVLPYTEDLSDEILYGLSARSHQTAPSQWAPAILVPRMDARPEVAEPLARLLGHVGSPDPGQIRWDQTGTYCRFVNEGSAAVSWDGSVSPCVALMHSYPCYVMGRRKEIRRFVLGNVGQEKIAEIWAREEFARFRGLVRDFDFSPCADCGGCNLADSNLEDCFGNGFPVCGDCLWARGVIQCP